MSIIHTGKHLLAFDEFADALPEIAPGPPAGSRVPVRARGGEPDTTVMRRAMLCLTDVRIRYTLALKRNG